MCPDEHDVLVAMGMRSSENPGRIADVIHVTRQDAIDHMNPQVVYRAWPIKADGFAGEVAVGDVGWNCVVDGLCWVIGVVYTIGKGFDEWVSQQLSTNVSRQVVGDAIGVAAMRLLYEEVISYTHAWVLETGIGSVSSAAHPGSSEWSLERGQSTVLQLVDAAEIGVEVNADGMMTPLKSCSMLLGVGARCRVDVLHHLCEGCSKRTTCEVK